MNNHFGTLLRKELVNFLKRPKLRWDRADSTGLQGSLVDSMDGPWNMVAPSGIDTFDLVKWQARLVWSYVTTQQYYIHYGVEERSSWCPESDCPASVGDLFRFVCLFVCLFVEKVWKKVNLNLNLNLNLNFFVASLLLVSPHHHDKARLYSIRWASGYYLLIHLPILICIRYGELWLVLRLVDIKPIPSPTPVFFPTSQILVLLWFLQYPHRPHLYLIRWGQIISSVFNKARSGSSRPLLKLEGPLP